MKADITVQLTTDPVPVYHIRARKPGPGLFIHAVRHGNELTGAEMARRFLHYAGRHLRRGRIVIVPVANPLALHQRTYAYISESGEPDDAAWPGNAKGSAAARLIYRLCQAIDEPSLDVCLDVHCGEPAYASWIIERENYPAAQALADICAFRIIRPSAPKNFTPAGYFNNTGRVGLTLELSGTYEVVEREVRRGLRACVNVARYLHMLPGEIEQDPPCVRIRPEELIRVAAPMAGIFRRSRRKPGDVVKAGEIICHLLRERDWQAVAIRAPADGILHTLGPNRPGAHNSLQARHAYLSENEILAEIAPI